MATREETATDSPDADPTIVAPRWEPPAILLLAVFLVVAFVLTFPHLSHLRTFVAGDSGDSILNLWIIRTVQHGLPHGWRTLWNAPNFYPAHTTLAYSETLFPIALLHWPLRLVLGDVLAFNVIYIGCFVLAPWCAYRLAMRYVDDWRAAFIAALAYSYSAIVLVHHGHFQLVIGSALVPLTTIALLRCLEAPSVRRGALLGLAFTTTALSASYYGAMLSVVIGVVGIGWLVWNRPPVLRPYLRAFAATVGVVAVVAGPFVYQYVRLQRDSAFRRGFDPGSATHFTDFLATSSGSYILRHLPVISAHSGNNSRLIENRLFPGFVALAFGIAGIVLTARRRHLTDDARKPRELWLIAAAGLVCIVLSFGDRFVLAHHKIPLPFAVFRHFIPGFAGIRATARLALFGQLALAMFAAVGIAAALRALRGKSMFVAAALAVWVVVEAAMVLSTVRVPTGADNLGVDRALRQRPAGVVLELPISSVASGVSWPYVEAPRQLEALRDGHPRVNGYSGFQPKNFDQEAGTLNKFPSPQALYEARRLGVRYIVLRIRTVGDVTPSVLGKQISKDGIGRYTSSTAKGMIAQLPPGTTVEQIPGGFIIELR